MTHLVRRLAMWASLGLVVGGLPSFADAYCVGRDTESGYYDSRYYSVSHEFRRAKFVITARVLREAWLDEDGKPKTLKPPFQYGSSKTWGFGPYVGAYYDVEVEEALKGNPPRNLRLFSENSSARFWLKVGSEWLLFITYDTFDDPIDVQLTADTCGNMRSLPAGMSVLLSVRKLVGTKR